MSERVSSEVCTSQSKLKTDFSGRQIHSSRTSERVLAYSIPLPPSPEGACDQANPPPPCEQTHTSGNITFPQLRWRVVIIKIIIQVREIKNKKKQEIYQDLRCCFENLTENLMKTLMCCSTVIYSSHLIRCMRFRFVVTVASCEHLHWIPHNPIVAIKKSQSQSYRVNSPLKAMFPVLSFWNQTITFIVSRIQKSGRHVNYFIIAMNSLLLYF